MTLDLSHLPTALRERACDSNEDRIHQVKEANWVGYSRANRALGWLDEMIRQPSCARMPCLLLYGESGMGKTMLVEKFERMHPRRHDRKTGIESRPVMIVQFPSGPDERRLFARILRALGAPFSGYWRIDALETATLNALALVRVQVLIIEEFHQLLAGNSRAQRISLNLIKTIANDLRISIFGVGTDEARYAIDADAQIRRRFDPFALPRWTETEDFRNFVSAFGKIFPLRKPSLLGERALVQRLLQASEGITGLVTRLLSLAAIEAIRTSSECIDAAGIDRAAKRLEDDFK
jgi:type II secretory pathway predicted ATPase ExeA